MQRIVSKLPAFTGAAAGTQPTCTPDILGRSFEWFMIRVVGTPVTLDGAVMDHRRFISCVEILIDGKVSSVFYPKQEWQKLQNFNANSDTLPLDTMLIPFARPGIPNSELGTADLRSVQIRVTVPATFGTGGALTRIEGYMSYFLENVPRAEAFVNRVVTPVTPGPGENVIDRLDLGSIARLRNMYFVCPAAAGDLYNPAGAAITRVQVRVGDLDVFDMDTEMVVALLALHPLYKRATGNVAVPVAGVCRVVELKRISAQAGRAASTLLSRARRAGPAEPLPVPRILAGGRVALRGRRGAGLRAAPVGAVPVSGRRPAGRPRTVHPHGPGLALLRLQQDAIRQPAWLGAFPPLSLRRRRISGGPAHARLSQEISDEGDYCPRRCITALRREVDQMNRFVAALAGGLKDGADGAQVESPIFRHQEFERLEAEGATKLGRLGAALKAVDRELSRRRT